MSTVAQRLARFVAGLKLDAVPAPVVANATDLVLDTLGNALAAARDDFGVAVLNIARDLGGPAESSLLGAPGKVAAANAVLANATLAHGLDFDDTREDAIVHTSCVAVTTALAVGEATGADGRAVLASIFAKGRAGLTEFTDEAAQDPSVLRVAKLVTYELDPTIDYPRQFIGDVEITLADGRVVHARQERPRGGPDAPLTRAELEAKFRGNAALVLPEAQGERVIRHVYDLSAGEPLSGLLAALSVEDTRR